MGLCTLVGLAITEGVGLLAVTPSTLNWQWASGSRHRDTGMSMVLPTDASMSLGIRLMLPAVYLEALLLRRATTSAEPVVGTERLTGQSKGKVWAGLGATSWVAGCPWCSSIIWQGNLTFMLTVRMVREKRRPSPY